MIFYKNDPYLFANVIECLSLIYWNGTNLFFDRFLTCIVTVNYFFRFLMAMLQKLWMVRFLPVSFFTFHTVCKVRLFICNRVAAAISVKLKDQNDSYEITIQNLVIIPTSVLRRWAMFSISRKSKRFPLVDFSQRS